MVWSPWAEFTCKLIDIVGERKRACLRGWDSRLDAVWPSLPTNGEQIVVDKQWGMTPVDDSIVELEVTAVKRESETEGNSSWSWELMNWRVIEDAGDLSGALRQCDEYR